MFDHWATGLRSGLLPQDCEVGTPETVQKGTKFERVFCEDFVFLVPGDDFLESLGRFSEVSRIFFTGVSPPGVQVGGEL